MPDTVSVLYKLTHLILTKMKEQKWKTPKPLDHKILLLTVSKDLPAWFYFDGISIAVFSHPHLILRWELQCTIICIPQTVICAPQRTISFLLCFRPVYLL